MPIHLDPTRPIYLQIMEEIKRRAVRGEYEPGARLPSVREMATGIAVNPNTVARVYLELEREQFVETRRGQGTFLTTDRELIDRARQQFADDAARRFVAEIDALGLAQDHRETLIKRVQNELNRYTTS